MNAHRAEREGVPHKYEAEPLWVDWSGFSAVWVCSCGEQGFGGLSLTEGRSAAMQHRAEMHPEWEATHKVHIERPPCQWGQTVWGAERGETCDRVPENGDMCRSHYTTAYKYDRLGMCLEEGCTSLCAPGQSICRSGLSDWARANQLDRGAVGRGEYVWPNVERAA